MTPPEPNWWGPRDEAILRGELAKLADIPSTAGTTYRASWWRRFWVRHPLAARILILIPLMVLGAIIGLTIREANAEGRPPYRIPDSGYPTTYGPPGPTGGP